MVVLREESEIRTQIGQALRERYSSQTQSVSETLKEETLKFIIESYDIQSAQQILNSAARLIFRYLDFTQVMIGLRSKEDGLFRHVVILGRTPTAKESLMKLAYTRDEMRVCKRYPGLVISKYCEFSIREDKPFSAEEINAFNRPKLLSKKRDTLLEMGEGDYIDVYIYDGKDDMVGWMELSNPKDGKAPSREMVRWLEMFAQILGLILKGKMP